MMGRVSHIKTLDEAIIFYLDDCQSRDMRKSTLDTKRRSLERFKVWGLPLGIHTPKQINLEVLEAYREYLYHYKKILDGKPLAINSKHKFLTDIKLFLRRLHKSKIISHADFEEFELPKPQKKIPRQLLSTRDIDQICQHTMMDQEDIGIRNRAIIELFYAAAIRRTELAELEVEHVDFEQQQLEVLNGKGLKQRVVPFSDRACKWLKLYLEKVRPRFYSLDSGNHLFIRKNGKPCGSDQIGQMVGKAIRGSGISKPGACHQFRHSVATGMLNNGADIRYIQALLGHADISTTQLYTHVAIRKLSEVYRATHPSYLGL